MKKLTYKQVRDSFFELYNYKREYIKDKKGYYRPKDQNEYVTDIRCAFVDYIDSLFKSGEITESQSNNITLK